MKPGTFIQKSSIVKRLRSVMISIILFIILCFSALSISNFKQLEDIQNLSTANSLLSLNTQAIESLNSTEQNMNVIFVRKDVSELRYKFEENLKVTKRLLSDSILLSSQDDLLADYLNQAIIALDQLEAGHEVIFSKLQNIHLITDQEKIEELNSDLLVASQYLIDAKEILRKIQININKNNEGIFTSIYKNRYRPLLIATLLCVLFLTFVGTIGWTIARNASKSILNLLDATEKVSLGNISYQAPIVEHDELGRVTDAFNRMVSSLEANQEQLNLAMNRTGRLQNITESFSEALTPDQVFEVMFEQLFGSMNAIAGLIILYSEDKNFLEIKRHVGYDQGTMDKWQKFPADTNVPIAEAVRTGVAKFMTSAMLKDYPLIEDIDRGNDFYTIAYLPLIIEGKSQGALTFSFPSSKVFDKPEQEFMLALARQCAQAIHRSQLYDDAKVAIEVRDEFLAIASHELRTPLTPLKMHIQSLARQVNNGKFINLTPERLMKMIETSDRQIMRLSVLIDDLLDVTRISAGKLSLNKENFSMKEMIEDVITQYDQQLKYSKSTVEFNPTNDFTGFWDKVRIEQVIINLLTNASKYAPNQPILITLSIFDDCILVQVKDRGPGITKENQERIFKRFERVSDKHNVGGLGLGLYICTQIVEAHRGKIYVESILGEGSIFTLELPKE
ncbi:MAG: GAF domain-containing protein [Bdellovibrionales bacterium]|nr:GAF domain-containing protein [Bdellovibrionales bacterium]